MCTFGVLGLSCETPAAPRAGDQPPAEGRKNENCGGRGKKRAKFWAVLGRGGPGEGSPVVARPECALGLLCGHFARAPAAQKSVSMSPSHSRRGSWGCRCFREKTLVSNDTLFHFRCLKTSILLFFGGRLTLSSVVVTSTGGVDSSGRETPSSPTSVVSWMSLGCVFVCYWMFPMMCTSDSIVFFHDRCRYLYSLHHKSINDVLHLRDVYGICESSAPTQTYRRPCR